MRRARSSATTSTAPSGEGWLDTGTVANRLRLGGRELDTETGFYYNRARYYDPQVGRFISEDPVGLAGGPNAYTFAANDPVNARDPSGNVCEWRVADDQPDAEVRAAAGRSSGRPYMHCEDGWTGAKRNYTFGGGLWGACPPCDWALGHVFFYNAMPSLNQKCDGTARVLEGNTRLVGRVGGFPPSTVQMGTAAIAFEQFGVRNAAAMRRYIGRISASVGGFTGVTDVIGGESPIPGVPVREALQQLYPGAFLAEVVGSADLGLVPIELNVPMMLGCPTGTQ